MIRAEGYTPDSPLVMTFTYPGGTTTYTDAELRQLQSDIRGVFELHWFTLRETAGDNSLEISGGGCSASDTVPVLADWFPEADCIAASEPAPADGDESAAYAETVLASEPFSYWRFEEESEPRR